MAFLVVARSGRGGSVAVERKSQATSRRSSPARALSGASYGFLSSSVPVFFARTGGRDRAAGRRRSSSIETGRPTNSLANDRPGVPGGHVPVHPGRHAVARRGVGLHLGPMAKRRNAVVPSRRCRMTNSMSFNPSAGGIARNGPRAVYPARFCLDRTGAGEELIVALPRPVFCFELLSSRGVRGTPGIARGLLIA